MYLIIRIVFKTSRLCSVCVKPTELEGTDDFLSWRCEHCSDNEASYSSLSYTQLPGIFFIVVIFKTGFKGKMYIRGAHMMFCNLDELMTSLLCFVHYIIDQFHNTCA